MKKLIIQPTLLMDAEAQAAKFPKTFPRTDSAILNSWFGNKDRIQQHAAEHRPIFALCSVDGHLIWLATILMNEHGHLVGVVSKYESPAPKEYPIGALMRYEQRHIIRYSIWNMDLSPYMP